MVRSLDAVSSREPLGEPGNMNSAHAQAAMAVYCTVLYCSPTSWQTVDGGPPPVPFASRGAPAWKFTASGCFICNLVAKSR